MYLCTDHLVICGQLENWTLTFFCLTSLSPLPPYAQSVHKKFKPINSCSISVIMQQPLSRQLRKACLDSLLSDNILTLCAGNTSIYTTWGHFSSLSHWPHVYLFVGDCKICTRAGLEGTARCLGLTLGWAPVSLFRRGPIMPAHPISHRWHE
jgi:hypothetical protein